MCLGGCEVARSGIERDAVKIDKRYAGGSKGGRDVDAVDEGEGSFDS